MFIKFLKTWQNEGWASRDSRATRGMANEDKWQGMDNEGNEDVGCKSAKSSEVNEGMDGSHLRPNDDGAQTIHSIEI